MFFTTYSSKKKKGGGTLFAIEATGASSYDHADAAVRKDSGSRKKDWSCWKLSYLVAAAHLG